MMKEYDVVVIGGGPGGYVAAIRASKLGRKVAIVEADHLGGTCLNRGCIPSKTLLRHSEAIELIRKAKSWGIESGEISFSLEKMMTRKDQVIKRLRTGIASLLKTGKIDLYQGYGIVNPDRTITVAADSQHEQIKAESVIVATGSTPVIPSIEGIDQVDVHTSDTIFDIKEIPKSLVIVGGGVIGVEIASIFSSLNVEVTIVEMADRLVPSEDPDASALMEKWLKKEKVKILTGTKVQAFQQSDRGKIVTVQKPDGQIQQLTSEQVLIAIGRKPNLSAISDLDLAMNGPFVSVNQRMQTSIPNVYAVGDVIGGWQLAHVASAEGLIAAANASGHEEEIDYRVVPRCIYTIPEIASVGIREEEAKAKGYCVKVEKYPLMAIGKALAMDEREGFIKIIAEEKYGEILGVVMVGPHVTEMISEASAFMYLEGTVEELAKMIHPHPSLSEGLFEAAAAWMGQGVHN
jgi:dihydrolipoamide dehydrogenase